MQTANKTSSPTSDDSTPPVNSHDSELILETSTAIELQPANTNEDNNQQNKFTTTIEFTESQLSELQQQHSLKSTYSGGSWATRLLHNIKVNLPLGLFGFGGPNTRVALFYDLYVTKHHWISDTQYTELLALLQGVPGPVAAQMVAAVSTIQSGYLGGLMGFLLFSFPALLILVLIAYMSSFVDIANPPRWLEGIQRGLSCATVGFSVSMFMKLVKKASSETFYALLMTLSILVTVMYRSMWIFPTLITIGGIASLVYNYVKQRVDDRVKRYQLSQVDFSRDTTWTVVKKVYYYLKSFSKAEAVDKKTDEQVDNQETADSSKEDDVSNLNYAYLTPVMGVIFLLACVGILLVNFFIRYVVIDRSKVFHDQPYLVKSFLLFECFYRYGIMIFGNGSVIPMMIQELVDEQGLITLNHFLNAYATSQFLTGPAFNFVGYLGYIILGVPGALISFVAIFLPGHFIAMVVLAFWKRLRNNVTFSRFLKGSNSIAIGFVVTGIYMLFYTSVDFGQPITSVILILCLALAGLFPELSVLTYVALGATVGGLYYHFVL